MQTKEAQLPDIKIVQSDGQWTVSWTKVKLGKRLRWLKYYDTLDEAVKFAKKQLDGKE